jgi:hypothetical protein
MTIAQTAAVAAYRPYLMNCTKCQGSGVFTSHVGRVVGQCFACDGEGKVSTGRAEEEAAKTVKVEALHEAFARAQATGIKRPRVVLGSMVVSLAPATGRNVGALYVKARPADGGTYLGKVVSGRFMASGDCTSAQQDQVADLLNDPLEAAIAYGKRTGQCCMCGRTLENAESIALGIGPICRERWFK